MVGSPLQGELESRGWIRLRPDEADSEVLLAGVAQLARALEDVPLDGLEIRHQDAVTRDWLVGNDRALANYDAVERALQIPDVVFASIHEGTDDEGSRQVARGRISIVDDWALLADLTVQPDHRRNGLARALMADLTEWAAERGASVMLLQVLADNTAAQALYASMGFRRHHAYRYLVAPQETD